MPARYTQYAMVCGMQSVNYMYTTSAPFLIPFIATAHGYTASLGWLLSAFSLPYVVGQIPGSMLALTVGEKALMTVNLLGNGLVLLVLPALARAGAMPLYLGLAGLGLLQSPRVPCSMAFYSRWIPDGESMSFGPPDSSHLMARVVCKILQGGVTVE